jgi:hypothetical protein
MNRRFHPFKNRIVALYSIKGYSIKELANHYGLDRSTLRKYLKEYGVYEKRGFLTKRCLENKKKSMISNHGVVNPGQIDDHEMQKQKAIKLHYARKGKWSGRNNPNYGNAIGNNYGFRGGIREDLDQYFRSSWEANFARILNYLGIKWYFEPKKFEISEGKTYTPDFYLPQLDTWVEIKGYWFDDAYEKYIKFITEYYQLRVKLIEANKYRWLIDRYYFISNLE